MILDTDKIVDDVSHMTCLGAGWEQRMDSTGEHGLDCSAYPREGQHRTQPAQGTVFTCVFVFSSPFFFTFSLFLFVTD